MVVDVKLESPIGIFKERTVLFPEPVGPMTLHRYIQHE